MISTQQARTSRGLIRGTSPFGREGSSALLPFDQAARFELRGVPGNIVQDVINISSDGTFVAVAIGYGFEEERARAVKLGQAPKPWRWSHPTDFLPGEVVLSQVPLAALVEGFRLNPKSERIIFEDSNSSCRWAARCVEGANLFQDTHPQRFRREHH